METAIWQKERRWQGEKWDFLGRSKREGWRTVLEGGLLDRHAGAEAFCALAARRGQEGSLKKQKKDEDEDHERENRQVLEEAP